MIEVLKRLAQLLKAIIKEFIEVIWEVSRK